MSATHYRDLRSVRSVSGVGRLRLRPAFDRFLKFNLSEPAAERFGVPARDILIELGRLKMIGGQEDMIVDTAMSMAKERGLLKDVVRAG